MSSGIQNTGHEANNTTRTQPCHQQAMALSLNNTINSYDAHIPFSIPAFSTGSLDLHGKEVNVLGIHALSGEFRYSVLSGTKANPTLVEKGRLVTPSEDDVPALMDWYETQFRLLITNHNPSKIAFRLTLDPKKKQLITSIFPLGILNLLAHKENISVASHTSRAFVASRLDLPKHTNIYDKCDEQFGENPPYWDKNQKNAVLVAWFELA